MAMAAVAPVTHFETYNLNPQQLEKLIQSASSSDRIYGNSLRKPSDVTGAGYLLDQSRFLLFHLRVVGLCRIAKRVSNFFKGFGDVAYRRLRLLDK